MAEELTHVFDYFGHSTFCDAVVDEISILAVGNYPLIAEDREMLGDIGIGGKHFPLQIAHGHFLVL